VIAAAWVAAAAALVSGAPSASTSLVPARPQVADRIAATAVVRVDDAVVDPSRVRVVVSFAPLDVLAGPVVERSARGGLTELRFRWDVACLNEDCVPGDAPRAVRLSPLRVTVTRRDGSQSTSVVRWPALSISGRVTRAEAGAATPPFRRETGLPRPTYRIAPGTLSAVLQGGAAALLLGAAALAVVGLLRLRRHRAAERLARLSPLERALLYAREAERRGPADRRRALGLLGRVLGGSGNALGGTASQLAWSPREPSPEQIETVVDQVEGGLET